MEFATEVYLNDLLLNAEANGFESAKESFYECIGLDSDIAMEGAGSTALKVLKGILIVPVILIAGVLAAAIIVVGGILLLIGTIIKTIIKLPAIIAQAVKDKRVIKEISERKSTGLVHESSDGNDYFKALLFYLDESFDDAHLKANQIYMFTKIPITKFAGEKYIEYLQNENSFDYDKLKELNDDIESGKSAKLVDEKLNNDLAKLKELRSKITESDTGFNFYVDESWARGLVNYANKGAKYLNRDKSIFDNYEKKLKNTKAACDKAKADNSKEVSLDNSCTYVDKLMLKYLQLGQVSLKHAGYAVKYASEWAVASGRGGYANKNLSEVQNG